MSAQTIVAISTPHGRGGISLIRLSGHDAHAILKQIFRSKKGAEITNPYKQYFGEIVSRDGEVLDEVLTFYANNPNSFTGEDMAEISCHGNPLVAESIVELCCSYSARLALPGEFTERAFLNGRIDLTQAEAIIDTINAKTAKSLKLAKSALIGKVYAYIEELRSEIIGLLASIEAAIDYSEEDITFLTRAEIEREIELIIEKIDALIASYERGRLLRDGVKIAIVGAPNSGKSSLLNALIGFERSIVSEHAGTTRDTVDAEISFNGVLAKIIDTAGIRNTADEIEKIGVERSRRAIEDADFVILVLDGAREMMADDFEIISAAKAKKQLIIINKSDIEQKIDTSKLNKEEFLYVSAKTGEGVLEMTTKIVATLNLQLENDEIALTTIFQKNQMIQAKEHAKEALKELSDGMSEEFLAHNLTFCAENLAKITGADVSAELLTELFSRFCVGK